MGRSIGAVTRSWPLEPVAWGEVLFPQTQRTELGSLHPEELGHVQNHLCLEQDGARRS